MNPIPWWTDFGIVRDLAHWMYGNGCVGASELLDILDSPWKFEQDYADMMAERAAEQVIA